ncbi:MAG: CHRD domain-containing protein, partial [Candidatus Nitrosocosmicus sp.]
MTITKTLKVTTVLTVLTIATFFMASGFSSLTMGSFLFTDVFAQGGQNIANQGISQANNAANTALCSAGVITGAACNTATNQGNSNSGSNTAGQTASGGTGTGTTTQTHFEAKMTGKNEVPPHETKATGTATFNLVGTDSITYTVHVKDMKMVTAAHIHQGKAGENGPVVVVLYNNSNPSATTNGELA